MCDAIRIAHPQIASDAKKFFFVFFFFSLAMRKHIRLIWNHKKSSRKKPAKILRCWPAMRNIGMFLMNERCEMPAIRTPVAVWPAMRAPAMPNRYPGAKLKRSTVISLDLVDLKEKFIPLHRPNGRVGFTAAPETPKITQRAQGRRLTEMLSMCAHSSPLTSWTQARFLVCSPKRLRPFITQYRILSQFHSTLLHIEAGLKDSLAPQWVPSEIVGGDMWRACRNPACEIDPPQKLARYLPGVRTTQVASKCIWHSCHNMLSFDLLTNGDTCFNDRGDRRAVL